MTDQKPTAEQLLQTVQMLMALHKINIASPLLPNDGMFDLFLHIAECNLVHGPVSIHNLLDATHSHSVTRRTNVPSKHQLSRMLTHLAYPAPPAKPYITLMESTSDRREKVVSLTPAAYRLIGKYHEQLTTVAWAATVA